MDVKTVFLNGERNEETYKQQSHGFFNKDQIDLIGKLQRILWNQVAWSWNKSIDQYFKGSRYNQSDADPCIFYKRVKSLDTESFVTVTGYVDDLFRASNDIQLVKLEKRKMSERFHMENQVESCYCLGISMKHKEEQDVLAIEKTASFTDVLKRFDMSNFKPIAIMMKTGKWLSILLRTISTPKDIHLQQTV